MTASTISAKDADLNDVQLATEEVDGVHRMKHVEDTAQRAQLLSALAAITPASVFHVESETNLAANAVFTGVPRDCGAPGTPSPYAYFIATFYSSHDSAPSGCVVESSNDEALWVVEDGLQARAGVLSTLKVPITARYYRVKMANGSTLTTALRVNSSMSRG